MEKFNVKKVFIKDFHPTFSDWCKHHKFPVTHPDNIEDCFVCYKDKNPIYSMFFWTTKSKVCVIGFPVSNPNISYKDKEGGLEFLFNKISEQAKKLGFFLMWTTTSTESVINILDKTGFVIGDKNVDQYVKLLN